VAATGTASGQQPQVSGRKNAIRLVMLASAVRLARDRRTTRALIVAAIGIPRQPVTSGRSGWALHSVSEPSYSRASSRPVSDSAKRSTVAEMPPPQ
jgi:hypothetical protein